MVEFMRPAFLVSEVIALIVLAWYGYWRRFPVFCGFLMITTFVGISHARIDQWAAGSWISWQAVLSVGRIMCAVEVVYKLTSGMPRKERAEGTAYNALFTIFVVMLFWGIRPGSQFSMAAIRMLNVEAGIAAFLVMAVVLFWSLSRVLNRQALRHLGILLVLALNKFLPLWMHPMAREQWDAVLALGCFVGICCCAALCVNSCDAPQGATPAPLNLPLPGECP